MNQTRQYILILLTKLILVVLYASFFAVQIFFNFETGKHPTGFSVPHLSKNAVAKSSLVKIAGRNKTSKDGKASTIRLNKRYQPATAASCKGIVIKPFVCFVTSKQHIHYCSGFIPASIPPIHLLRGPPFVA